MGDDAIARLTLPRSKRLKQNRDFLRLKAQGRRIVSPSMIINWLARDKKGPSRLGVVTSRALGNAVLRNRLRRIFREIFRAHQHHFLQPLDLVVVPRAKSLARTFAELEQEFCQALSTRGMLKVA